MNWLKNKKGLIVLLVFIIASFSIYKYLYKSHSTIENSRSHFIGGSKDFYKKEFQNFSKWEGVIVEITGEISSVDGTGIGLTENIYCHIKDTLLIAKLKKSDRITIKGRVVGYDDLLEELKLDKCIIIK